LGQRIRIQAGPNGDPKRKKRRDFMIEKRFGGLEASPGAWTFFLKIQEDDPKHTRYIGYLGNAQKIYKY
jgi:hypothetical protein